MTPVGCSSSARSGSARPTSLMRWVTSPAGAAARSTPNAVDVLIIDDFALQTHDATQTTDFYEIAVERHLKSATIVTSNRTPDEWLTALADPLLAQSAIDRLQSTAWELVVEGEPYRRRQKPTLNRPQDVSNKARR
jgi:predicted ATPase